MGGAKWEPSKWTRERYELQYNAESNFAGILKLKADSTIYSPSSAVYMNVVYIQYYADKILTNLEQP